MGKTARSVVDTILGEAVSGSRQTRFEDMMAIASTIANRAAATGVSMEDIVSAPNQYSAYGRALPAGVEAYRSLAEAALAEVQTNGPTTSAQYYATPDAVRGLPSGLTPVGQTRGHQFFEDPANRPMVTAVGVRQPGQLAYDVEVDDPAAAPQDALDAIFGLGAATAATSPRTQLDADLDAVFGLEPSNAAPASLDDDLDAVFGFEPAARSGLALGSIDDPTAEWDGQFSNPLGAITNRSTDEFGMRNAPNTPLGVGSTNHRGIDLSAEPGELGYAAEAIGPGTVISAGSMKGYGNAVTVEHPNGMTSVYGHLRSINVQKGDVIARGTPVGTVGASGRASGPHLHLEVRDQLGNALNPRDVVDMSMRDTISPTSRPMSPTEQRSAASAYSGMASSLASAGMLGVGRAAPPSSGLPSGFDATRFAADVMPSISLRSAPAMSAFAGTQPSPSPAPSAMPSADRFGMSTAAIDPARFGPPQMASPAPARFGPVDMASTAKTGRLSSTVSPSSSTPMAANLSQALSSPTAQAFADFGIPTSRVSTTSVAPSSMGLLPSTAQAPVGSFSAFNPVPTNFNAVTDMANTMKAQPLTMPNLPAVPNLPLAYAPTVAPMVAPMTRVPQQTPRSAPAPAPRPSFDAYDVYSGKAPAGYQAQATGGNLVSRDPFGNTSVTNKYGATTVTDPSGRQMAQWDGLDFGGIGKPSPGMVGAAIGGTIAGFPGALIGGVIGNRVAGQPSQTRTGSLGGLGGFLSGIFGGGSDGGASGGGGRSSGGGRGSSGPAGRDRDNSGNR